MDFNEEIKVLWERVAELEARIVYLEGQLKQRGRSEPQKPQQPRKS